MTVSARGRVLGRVCPEAGRDGPVVKSAGPLGVIAGVTGMEQLYPPKGGSQSMSGLVSLKDLLNIGMSTAVLPDALVQGLIPAMRKKVRRS